MSSGGEKEEAEALRLRIRDLEAALGQKDEGLANTFKLAPKMTDLLGLLLSLPIVTSDQIDRRLGIASDAKVAIHRLRKELAPWSIAIFSKRLRGYWLDDETKAKIKQLISPAQDEPDTEVA
jgi:hypothetical protein